MLIERMIRVFIFCQVLIFTVRLSTWGQFSVEKLFGNATFEVRLADSVDVENGLAKTGQTFSHAHSGTSFWVGDYTIIIHGDSNK